MVKFLITCLLTILLAIFLRQPVSRMEHPGVFDPLRCAALHNRIVEIIAPTALAAPYENAIVRNFFTAYGPPGQALRERLSREMIAFLENIDISVAPEDGRQMNFGPFLGFPTQWMFEQLNYLPLTDDPEGIDKIITLYGFTEQGIFFDLNTGLCTWNNELMPWPQKWYPLERALEFHLKQYEIGKYQPGNSEFIVRYTKNDLDRNLDAYHSLLTAIQTRIPGSTIGEPGLIDPRLLDKHSILNFRRDFLLRARKPSFEFIAPGIRIPTSSWLDSLLTADHGSERYVRVRSSDYGLMPPTNNHDTNDKYDGDPFPLFPGPLISETSQTFDAERGPGKLIVGKTSGLYLWPEWPVSVDHAKFILPFPLGGNGNIQSGNPDLSPDVAAEVPVHEWRIGNDVLYTHGPCPFGPPHPAKLFTVLENWTEIIKSGRWYVDENGVCGGIEVFRDADTRELGREYLLGACEDRAREDF